MVRMFPNTGCHEDGLGCRLSGKLERALLEAFRILTRSRRRRRLRYKATRDLATRPTSSTAKDVPIEPRWKSKAMSKKVGIQGFMPGEADPTLTPTVVSKNENWSRANAKRRVARGKSLNAALFTTKRVLKVVDHCCWNHQGQLANLKAANEAVTSAKGR